ncbi:MAG TPA: translation initiation factor IF-2 [Candidatus Limnocylindrales bacterium]|nr:translation initiation factor IF-2 [Candidatus Limnocylindrales bacterium]
MPVKKRRVYEVAKDMGMSSEALVHILKSLSVEVKSHMSSVSDDVIEQVRSKLAREKEAVKEEEARKREKAVLAAKAEAERRGSPPGRGPSAPFKLGSKPGKKKKRAVDEKLIRASVKRTLAEMEGSKRRHHRREREEGAAVGVEETARVIRVSEFISVAELAGQLEVKPQEVLQVCLQLGIMANINRRLDKDSIMAVADEFGYAVEFVSELGEEEEEVVEEAAGVLLPRPPVVTIMGHVDHGKTSLLDYIRKTNVIAGEAGGITQHIGAYEVELARGQKITFLDTPGHEAFTAMRARGAQATDLVVIVVAADDRVMPQTVEAIDHARAANVPIIVAINKIDLPGANVDLVRQELTKQNVLLEEWGGKTIAVPISAKIGTGVDKLLEMILLQAEVLELKADPSKHARGVVIESRVEQGRGIVATVLVQKGTLRVGDAFVAGSQSGKVRAMTNERGGRVTDAGPSTPVEILGWSGSPQAGDNFAAMIDEREAREVASKRGQLQREQEFRLHKHVTLTDLYSQIKAGNVGELLIVLKADMDGSVEALEDSLTKLTTEEVKLRVIHRGVGQISESDVLLAAASNAVIIGFHVKPDPKAQELGAKEKVDVRLYEIIYEAVADVKDAMSGLLKPEIRETVIGSAEVRQVFTTTKAGTIAGCKVVSGTITRSARARLVRESAPVWDGRIESLRRFKDDVREVAAPLECGIGLEGRDDVKMNDVIEAYVLEEFARRLS